jgi:hypothetical protein
MALKADLTTEGFDVLQIQLTEIIDKANDLNSVADDLRLIFQEDLKLRFASSPAVETGGQVYGGAYWAALSPVTLIRRGGGKVLIDSGDLERSLTSEGDGNNIFEVINGTEVTFGSLLPYASRVNADRPFLFWHPFLLEKMAIAISNWLGGNFES